MFPLNGPCWSLFFEYIASFLYAIVLHRLSKRALWWIIILSGLGLASCAVFNLSGAYHIGMGWSMGDWGFFGGLCRVTFSFTVGLLMTRDFRKINVRGAFWICSAVIAVLMACPYVGGPEASVLNGIYDSVATLFIFPAVVYLGACGMTTDAFSGRVCEFLGNLSYPVYIIHYPIMYLFYAWVWAHGYTFGEVWYVCVVLFVVIITLAWTVMRFYDEPVRRLLSARWLKK